MFTLIAAIALFGLAVLYLTSGYLFIGAIILAMVLAVGTR
jgi:hypothetical protein